MARLLVAGLLMAAAAPVLAQTAPVSPYRPLPGAQTMTRADVQARAETRFARRDVNRDGFHTADEMGRHEGKMRRAGNRQAARDPNAAFDRVDANRDGSISRDEFAQARETRTEKRAAMKQHRGKHGGGMMRMADADRDGRVSRAEATAGALQRFDLMDSNRDGRLTPEERAAGRAHMRQMRRAG